MKQSLKGLRVSGRLRDAHRRMMEESVIRKKVDPTSVHRKIRQHIGWTDVTIRIPFDERCNLA